MDPAMNCARRLVRVALPVLLAGCAMLAPNGPPRSDEAAKLSFSDDARQVTALLADAPRLVALTEEEGRAEQQAASAAYGDRGADATRVQLAWLLALGVGGRNDARLLMLLDESACMRRVPDSPLRQFCSVLQRVAVDRLRAQQETQGRAEARQRETESRLRETESRLRESDSRLRDMQGRADSLQQKLDAVLEVERKLIKRH
jgi:hypothetical protein